MTGAPPAWLLSVLTVGLAAAVAVFAWLVYGAERYSWRPCAPAGPGCTALARKLGIDEAYERFTAQAGGPWWRCSPTGSSGAWTASIYAGDLVARLLAGRWRRFQNGLVRLYATGVLTGAVLLLAFLVSPRHQIAPPR